jgi:alpha-tubulin suppressor-like RCC1 family protein
MVSCGAEHCTALTTKGEIFTWGLNFKGQLGTGDFENRYEPEIIENVSFD